METGSLIGPGVDTVIGTSIGRYEVLKKVGEGGMATVYRGRHTTLDRDVAIKVLHPHLSSSARNRERFAREARAIEHLAHPHILEIHDYSGPDAEKCWIVTEFVDGETLTDLLNRSHRVPSEVACVIGIALAEALGFAHLAGVLHRDLKPDNVMIRSDGVIKLMDFGIARFLDESQVTMTGALVGSPAFMSPEQAREEELGPRSDLFSLGTMLYLLVTGALPFQGKNPSIILRNIIEGRRASIQDLAPDASGALVDVIERLLSPQPDDRFPDASSVAQALRDALAEVGFQPEEPRWALARYVEDPEAWERQLQIFLSFQLLQRARLCLSAGDPLQGLRMINRLLEMDPNNEEAVDLLQELHTGVTDTQQPAARRRAAIWLPVMLVFTLLPVTWWLTRSPAPPADASSVSPADDASAPVAATAQTHAEPDSDAPSISVAGGAAAPSEGEESDLAPPNEDPGESADAAEPARPSHSSSRPATLRVAPRVASRAPARGTAGGEAPSTSEPASPPTEPLEEACVAIRAEEGYAEIFHEGVRLGNTRDRGCRKLPAGTHTFQLRHRTILDQDVTLTLKPGEQRTEVVPLTHRPARVRFLPKYGEDCLVSVDGVPRGTLAALGGEVQVADPTEPHEVILECGDVRYRRAYDSMRYPDITFDGVAEP